MYYGKFLWTVRVFLLSVLLLSGCSKLPTTPKLTLESLKNTEYEIYAGNYVQLTNGVYGNKSEYTSLTLQEQPMAFADLDADGLEDAIVILELSGGGSGIFMLLEVVLNKNGEPLEIAKTGFGDRAQIDSIQISGDIITVEGLTHGPEDGLCCPSLKATWRWRFKHNRLIVLE